MLVQGAARTPTGRCLKHGPAAWRRRPLLYLSSNPSIYLSSNPSISEAGDAQSGDEVEDFPRSAWPDERVADFIARRFDPALREPRVVEDRFRRVDGGLSPRRVRYWTAARARARRSYSATRRTLPWTTP